MVKKFVKVVGDVSISHDDQEKDGLAFRVQFKYGSDHIMLISGEEAAIQNYITAHGCTVINRTSIKSLYDETFPTKTVQCEVCGGTGNIIIPEYDVDKEETNIKKVT